MDTTRILFAISSVFLVVTFAPLYRRRWWWLRLFEFPRAQIAIVLGFVFVCTIWVWGAGGVREPYLHMLTIVFAAVSLSWQCYRIYPYTKFAPTQIENATGSGTTIRILVANIRLGNQNYQALVKLVQQCEPDVVLVVEPDEWWCEKLSQQCLQYRTVIAHPLANTYGIMMMTNCTVVDSEIRFLRDEDLPSIHATLELTTEAQKVQMRFHGLHPRPPVPNEALSTRDRDAELRYIAAMVHEQRLPAIVAGDLNDVGWSWSSREFLRASGLRDPRIGRGMFATFHAKLPLLRFPLDHVFASKHFQIKTLSRHWLPGSDHLSVIAELELHHETDSTLHT